MKKRIFSLLLALVLAVSLLPTALAADSAITVHVTIAVGGELVTGEDGTLLAAVPVSVTDLNDSGTYDIDDALSAAHALYCPDGYASAEGSYGLSIMKLWNDESGSFGYYYNNTSAWSLADTLSSGAHLTAFVYADAVAWTDTYTKFNAFETVAGVGEPLSITLSAMGYDESWNTVWNPLADASISVAGSEEALAVTGEDGTAGITFSEPGVYTLTAAADGIVPPVCTVTVLEGLTYTDINDHWALEAICFAHEKGLIAAESATTFAPDAVMTRAATATALYQLAGAPAVTGESSFADVTANHSAHDAIIWAAETGVTLGLPDGTFAPDDTVTREQLVVMILRYLQTLETELEAAGSLIAFSDADDVSGYALSAMTWAVSAGIVQGSGGRLNPQSDVTAAQTALMLYRAAQAYSLV